MKIHSIADVITNSSTELFVFKSNKTAREIDRKLKELFGYCGAHAIRATNNKHLHSAGWGDNSGEYDIGDMLILGDDDNSIPYEIFDRIEEVFNARRYHLG